MSLSNEISREGKKYETQPTTMSPTCNNPQSHAGFELPLKKKKKKKICMEVLTCSSCGALVKNIQHNPLKYITTLLHDVPMEATPAKGREFGCESDWGDCWEVGEKRSERESCKGCGKGGYGDVSCRCEEPRNPYFDDDNWYQRERDNSDEDRRACD